MTGGKKRSLFFLISIFFLYFSSPPAFSEITTERLRIGVVPFRALESIEVSDARMISEIVETHLSEYQSFELVEVGGDEIRQETAVQLSGLVSTEEAIEIGGRLSLRYLLSGTCTSEGDDGLRLTVLVGEVEAEQVVYGKTELFSKDDIETKLRIFVADLAAELEQLSFGQSVANIESLIRMHRWDEAYAALRTYFEVRGETEEYRRLVQEVYRGLEKRYLSHIRMIQEERSPREWIDDVPLFLVYGERGENRHDVLEDLYFDYNLQMTKEAAAAQERILSTAKRGNMSLARELLASANDMYPPTVELGELKKKLDSMDARRHADKARVFHRAGDYRQAQYYAKRALSLDSDTADYIRLLRRIEEAQAQDDEKRRTIEAEKPRWTPTRRKNRYVEVSTALAFYSDKLRKAYVDGGFPTMGVEYTQYSVVVPPLYRSVSGGAGVAWGESSFSGNNKSITSSFLHSELFGGIGVSLRFNSIEFGVELRGYGGVLSRSINFDQIDPSLSGEEWGLSLSPALQGYLRYGFGSHVLAGIAVNSSPVYLLGEGRLSRFRFALDLSWCF